MDGIEPWPKLSLHIPLACSKRTESLKGDKKEGDKERERENKGGQEGEYNIPLA
jgi:hypothetical protein